MDHCHKVRQFMELAQQELPESPTIPDEATLRLRAKLILEETVELIHGLGFDIVNGQEGALTVSKNHSRPPNLAEIIDGVCDVRVVTTGTLLACGVPPDYFQDLVDDNNLEKFGPGSYKNEYGKWIKPPSHRPPDIAGHLEILKKSCHSD